MEQRRHVGADGAVAVPADHAGLAVAGHGHGVGLVAEQQRDAVEVAGQVGHRQQHPSALFQHPGRLRQHVVVEVQVGQEAEAGDDPDRTRRQGDAVGVEVEEEGPHAAGGGALQPLGVEVDADQLVEAEAGPDVRGQSAHPGAEVEQAAPRPGVALDEAVDHPVEIPQRPRLGADPPVGGGDVDVTGERRRRLHEILPDTFDRFVDHLSLLLWGVASRRMRP